MGLEACPLCMTQRVFVVLWGVIALIGALHNPRHWGRRVYGALCGLAAWAGAAVAARHVWLQHLPADQVPACGPSLDYMLENLPFRDTLSIVAGGRRQLRRNPVDLPRFQHPGTNPGSVQRCDTGLPVADRAHLSRAEVRHGSVIQPRGKGVDHAQQEK